MLAKFIAACQENGITVSFTEQFCGDRLSLIWYGKNIITLECGNRVGKISAIGDVIFNVRSEQDNTVIAYYRNTDNTGMCENEDVLHFVSTDEELESNAAVGLVDFLCNNWLEFDVYEGNKLIAHFVDENAESLSDVFEDFAFFVESLKK